MDIKDIDGRIDELLDDMDALILDVRTLRDKALPGTKEKLWLRRCGSKLDDARAYLFGIDNLDDVDLSD